MSVPELRSYEIEIYPRRSNESRGESVVSVTLKAWDIADALMRAHDLLTDQSVSRKGAPA